MNKPKRGRPVTTGTPPARQLGRIHDAEWQELQQAAAESGLHFSVWAKNILLKTARKQRKTIDSGKNSEKG